MAYQVNIGFLLFLSKVELLYDHFQLKKIVDSETILQTDMIKWLLYRIRIAVFHLEHLEVKRYLSNQTILREKTTGKLSLLSKIRWLDKGPRALYHTTKWGISQKESQPIFYLWPLKSCVGID